MEIISGRNVHQLFPHALEHLQRVGVAEDSRNGPVLAAPIPIATVYRRPTERVIFHPWRDANPFFHFYESLWMLAGRNDIAPLTRYAKQLAQYSDDGKTMNAAYGHRWRHAVTCDPHWGGPVMGERDQLDVIIDRLQPNRLDRRCVLQIWDHNFDLRGTQDTQTKDVACNLMVTFQIGKDTTFHEDDVLNMVVFCRSNDIIWGCYGANAVHFSFLLEYMASCIGVKVGTYTQISVNWHAYRNIYDKMFDERDLTLCPYEVGDVQPYPLMSVPKHQWDKDVRAFVTSDGRPPIMLRDFHDPFFREVAYPIVQAHTIFKDRNDEARFPSAIEAVEECAASDWQLACKDWLARRWAKAQGGEK